MYYDGKKLVARARDECRNEGQSSEDTQATGRETVCMKLGLGREADVSQRCLLGSCEVKGGIFANETRQGVMSEVDIWECQTL